MHACNSHDKHCQSLDGFEGNSLSVSTKPVRALIELDKILDRQNVRQGTVRLSGLVTELVIEASLAIASLPLRWLPLILLHCN